jgi:hypothetical protein
VGTLYNHIENVLDAGDISSRHQNSPSQGAGACSSAVVAASRRDRSHRLGDRGTCSSDRPHDVMLMLVGVCLDCCSQLTGCSFHWCRNSVSLTLTTDLRINGNVMMSGTSYGRKTLGNLPAQTFRESAQTHIITQNDVENDKKLCELQHTRFAYFGGCFRYARNPRFSCGFLYY